MDVADAPDNVILTGEKDKEFIRQELRSADAFMFLSSFPGEGFSNSLAEAMAAGLPCIVTDWAANKDMIEDKGGVVVPVHGVEEACKGLEWMAEQSVRGQQSEYNIEKIKREYADSVVQAQYVKCYEELLK